MNCKPSNSCCSPTQQWKDILLNTQDKAIQAYNLAQQALDEIENLPAGGGSVQSVNGELPDQDGDVTVDTGVMTVNGVSPDADGEITITAGSNITITPNAGTNSIEISASGGTQDWILVTDKYWAKYMDSSNIALTDLYIIASSVTGDYLSGEVLVPKGMRTNDATLEMIRSYTTLASEQYMSIVNVNTILNDNTTISNVNVILSGRTTIGSGIDEFVQYAVNGRSSAMTKAYTASGSGIRLYVKEVL